MLLNRYEEIPYDMLTYLIAECNFGGRAIDGKDKILIRTLLKDYITPKILNDDYFFDNPLYFAPKDGPYEHYLNHIENFPRITDVTTFGFHHNA